MHYRQLLSCSQEPVHVIQNIRGAGPAMQPPEKKLKRRVPDTQRQRVSISCDRCKVRKIRCIRIPGKNDPCAACVQLNLNCESTLPRKQRVYASYDELQSRYRALDTLIKRLYPDENVESVEEIRELARKQGVDLSEFEDEGEGLDPLPKLSDRESSGTTSASKEGSSLFDTVQNLRIPEGALIPAPRGGYHYVGPASSYQFANTIRHLVKKSSACTLAFDRVGYRRQQRANEFTSSDRTTALEARILGHPVMVGEDEASPMSGSMGRCPSDVGPVPSPQDQTTPRSIPHSITRRTIDIMPSRQLADKLVRAFFDRVHLNFNLFHRGSFQVRYESIWSSRSEAGLGDLEPGWLCVLCMVFVLGAQSLERDGLPEATAIQSRYLAIVIREGMQRLVLTATLSNVQALALLSLYQHNAGERNTAWMLIGHAAHMAVALGMQRDGENSNFDFIERNTRRIIWWTLYVFEQNLSFVLGRPSATSTLEISASLPDEAVTGGADSPPGYLEYAVKLSDISAMIKRFVAAISADFDKTNRLATTTDMANQLDELLLQWDRSLPPHLKYTAQFATAKQRRTVHLLHVAYNHLRSVLGRPYLLCKINHDLDNPQASLPINSSSSLASAITALSQTSLSAARSCMETLLSLASVASLEGEVWYDYYYVHHASLILSLPFLVDFNDQHVASDRAIISMTLNLAQKSRLAPTYRILINVSIQFAKIVGIGPDDDPSRPASPRLGASSIRPDLFSSGRPMVLPEGPTGENNHTGWNLETRSITPENSDDNRSSGPGAHYLISGMPHEAGSDADSSTVQWPTQLPYHTNATISDPWSLLPILSSTPSSQPLSLEQLLGMQPSTLFNESVAQQPVTDLGFSDMYNFGFGLPAQNDGAGSSDWQGGMGEEGGSGGLSEMPWDFFAGEDWGGGGNEAGREGG